PIDGFFTNGWPSTGALTVCYCDSCKRVYGAIGGTPPGQTDATSAVYRKYYDVYMGRVLDVWRGWQQVVTEKRPGSGYVVNLGGGVRTGKNGKRLGDVARWVKPGHHGPRRHTPTLHSP